MWQWPCTELQWLWLQLQVDKVELVQRPKCRGLCSRPDTSGPDAWSTWPCPWKALPICSSQWIPVGPQVPSLWWSLSCSVPSPRRNVRRPFGIYTLSPTHIYISICKLAFFSLICSPIFLISYWTIRLLNVRTMSFHLYTWSWGQTLLRGLGSW